MSASSVCSLPCWPPCGQAIGWQQGAGARTRTQSLRTRSPSFGTGWEGRSYGKGSVNILNVVAVATSPLEAAGVTESGAFSQSDDELASRGLSVHSTLDDLDLDQLNSLFAKVSFPRREKQKLLKALQNTQSLLWIHELKSKQLVAFARATGDGVYHAIIWDVVVDPSYQGLGLGKVLMERLMADLVVYDSRALYIPSTSVISFRLSRYDIAMNRWLRVAELPGTVVAEVSCRLVPLDGELYVIPGGPVVDFGEHYRTLRKQTGSSVFQVYDPKTSVWQFIPFPRSSRQNVAWGGVCTLRL